MASNAPANTGGYDCKFVQEPSNDLKCLICLCVAKDPLQHGEGGCGKIFCRSCITEYRKRNNKCPNCRRDITTFKDVRSERDIQSLKVKCENTDNGCEWTDELHSLENHLQKCDYALLLCPNECDKIEFQFDDDGCFFKIRKFYRKDLGKHVMNECRRRQHTCPHCQETGEYYQITGCHTEVCLKLKIKCSNAPQCQDLIPREDLQTHLSTDCLYQNVSCKYKEFGCEVTSLRKDLQEHEKDDKLHLHITMDTILTLKKRTDMLMPFYLSSVHGTPQLMFKVTEFAVKKQMETEFYSTPFYTHPQGYKMTINVDANGCGPGKGTHVSVWAYLIKGENDDELEFPFQGTITFELLNQLEDKNHHKASYTYEGYEKGSLRVRDYDRAGSASGEPRFISHDALDRNAAKNCCYLKDDCLVFRIYVEVPSYKPWLQCSV